MPAKRGTGSWWKARWAWCARTIWRGRILSINTNAAESLGYRSEEMVGKLLIDFVPDDQKETFRNYLRASQVRRGAGDAQPAPP